MRLWRRLLRVEMPRQAIAPWRRRDWFGVVLAALLVAMVSSWPRLVEPSLRPGVPAPFTVRAPKAATVVDSDALEQRRSQLGPRTHVQVVDPRINRELEQRLERQLQAIQQLASTDQEQVAPLDLSPEERDWLANLPPARLKTWENNLRERVTEGEADSPVGGEIQPRPVKEAPHGIKKTNRQGKKAAEKSQRRLSSAQALSHHGDGGSLCFHVTGATPEKLLDDEEDRHSEHDDAGEPQGRHFIPHPEPGPEDPFRQRRDAEEMDRAIVIDHFHDDQCGSCDHGRPCQRDRNTEENLSGAIPEAAGRFNERSPLLQKSGAAGGRCRDTAPPPS